MSHAADTRLTNEEMHPERQRFAAQTMYSERSPADHDLFTAALQPCNSLEPACGRGSAEPGRDREERQIGFYPEIVGKTWVLSTETKGTGANMVPLDRVTKHSSSAEPLFVPPKRREPRPDTPEARAPRRFRIVDVMSRLTLADDVDARGAVDALERVRSLVDVDVYVWQEARERWRPLTSPERHAIWELAHD